MSKIKNEPKYKNMLLQAIRAQLEHRAFWLYLLCDEAACHGRISAAPPPAAADFHRALIS